MEMHASRKRAAIVGGLVTLFVAIVCRLNFDLNQPLVAQAEEAAPAELPSVELMVTPSVIKTSVDKKVTFELMVTNVGQTPATKLLIVDHFDDGLKHAVAESPIEHDLADIAPGKSQRLNLTFSITKAGLLSHSAEVRSHGKTVATVKASVRAMEAGAAQEPPGESVEPQPAQAKPAEEPAMADAPKPEAKSSFPDIPYRQDDPDAVEEKAPDLGEPLVENPESLKKLQPDSPIWIDRKGRRVVIQGGVCLRQGYLELLACIWRSKEHESIITVPVKAVYIHGALLAIGAEPGKPVQFEPEYKPASGTEIDLQFHWKDKDGKLQKARAQEWVRSVKTKKPLEYPWVFAGSRFLTNPQTGKIVYQADRDGDLICVSNFPSAMLDLPVESSSANADLLYEANTEKIPPVGTPITIVLTPKEKKAEAKPESSEKPEKPSVPAKPEAPAKAAPPATSEEKP